MKKFKIRAPIIGPGRWGSPLTGFEREVTKILCYEQVMIVAKLTIVHLPKENRFGYNTEGRRLVAIPLSTFFIKVLSSI